MQSIAGRPSAGQTMVCRIVLEHRGMHVPSYGLQETESVHWYRKEYGAFLKPEVFHITDGACPAHDGDVLSVKGGAVGKDPGDFLSFHGSFRPFTCKQTINWLVKWSIILYYTQYRRELQAFQSF